MRIAVSFTGGKDSTTVAAGYILASRGQAVPPELRQRLLQDLPPSAAADLAGVQVALLVTFMPATGAPFRAHPLELIQAQAQALGVPHHICRIEGPDYLASYRAAIAALKEQQGIDALATGDILDVCSNFMGRACDGLVPLLRPLWHVPRRELLGHLWALGVQARVSCINVHKLGPAHGDALARDAHYACHLGNGAAAAPTQCHDAVAAATAATAAKAAASAPADEQDGRDQGPGASSTGPPQEEGAAVPQAKFDHLAAGGEQAGGLRDDWNPVKHLLGQDLTPELHAKVLVPVSERYGVDECGEMGEFHTMCLDACVFSHALEVQADACHEPGAEFAFLSVRGIKAVAKAEAAAAEAALAGPH